MDMLTKPQLLDIQRYACVQAKTPRDPNLWHQTAPLKVITRQIKNDIHGFSWGISKSSLRNHTKFVATERPNMRLDKDQRIVGCHKNSYPHPSSDSKILSSHCRLEMSRSGGQCSTGVGLGRRREAVVLLAAGLGSLAGDGKKASVAGAIGNG